MSCDCPVGRTGEFCEDQRDFCVGEAAPPCHPLVTCINSPTNFTCGSCPNGYEGNGRICLGKNFDAIDRWYVMNISLRKVQLCRQKMGRNLGGLIRLATNIL